MASLPLFSPSFLPKEGVASVSPRPTPQPRSVSEPLPDPAPASVADRQAPATAAARLAKARAEIDRIARPILRSLFDPLPAPARPVAGAGIDESPAATRPGRGDPSAAASSSGDGRPLAPARSGTDGLSVPAFGAGAADARFVDLPRAGHGADAKRSATVERTEAALREAGFAGRFWRGDALSASPLPATPSGFRALDEELPGGGWPSRCMTELLLAQAGVGEIRFLASTLSSLTQAGRDIVLLSPPYIPDPTGWEQLGVDMRRVLIVRTPRPADRLWALEEGLKSSAFGALIAWLPEEKVLARHDTLRRLQLAATVADGLTFVMRPLAARDRASPAPLRLSIAPGRPDGRRRTLSVQLLKRRGPVLARPMTLQLPEIHRGLKAFRAHPEPRPVPRPLRVVRPSHRPIDRHALAGPVLSDARA